MRFFLTMALLALTLDSACAAAQAQNHQTSPAKAVQTVQLDNFYQVAPDLYRSGQPSAEQMKALEKMGVKTILSLRQFNSDDKEAQGTAFNLYRVPVNAGRIKDKHIIEALKIIHNAPKPVLVHCWHGSDRTGAVVAMYRIVFEDWSKQAAIDELMQPQYGHHQRTYRNIPEYIKQADVEAIRRAVLAE